MQNIQTVSSVLTKEDIRIRRRLRWGIGRNSSSIEPGLYALGNPASDSPVLVSSNYRMSFDYLRSSLRGRSAWILVLDTKGINVWCAAGKGTFGTKEIIKRAAKTGLADIVTHRTLILPQLGAPGVEAHVIKKTNGFKVEYGPVRSADIGEYLDNGLRASEKMRTVTSTLKDRAVLTPVELIQSWKAAAALLPFLLLFHLLRNKGISAALAPELALGAGSIITGAVLTPLLLPWIPGRSFALKGWIAALVILGAPVFYGITGLFHRLALFILLPAISSYLAMQFTGASTYTSISGVETELRRALPFYIFAAAAATGLLIADLFIKIQ